MRHNPLPTDYTLDLYNGFLSDSLTGAYIFSSVVDELFFPCSDVSRIKVICPNDYTDIHLNSLTEQVTAHIRKCNAIEVLVLEYGTNAALKLIGLTDSGTNLQRLQLNAHQIVIDDENGQNGDIGRSVPNLVQLICSIDELSLFSSNQLVQQLFVKTDVFGEAEFNATKEFLQQNIGLSQFSLTHNNNPNSSSSNMARIVEYFHSIRQFEYFKMQDTESESIFGYDKDRKLLQTTDNVNFFTIYEDYTVLRVNLRSRRTIPGVLQIISEQSSNLESLFLHGHAVVMHYLIDRHNAEYNLIITTIPNLIIHSSNDKIMINNVTKSNEMFAYTNFACSHITSFLRTLIIYFHGNEDDHVKVTIAHEILQLKKIENLNIGRDNGLMPEIIARTDPSTHLRTVNSLNLCKEAALAVCDRCYILALANLKQVSIWNDIPGEHTLSWIVDTLRSAIVEFNLHYPQMRLAWMFKINDKNSCLISGQPRVARRSISSAATLH